MARIKQYGTGSSETIEAYVPRDPYYYEVDNRPLINLADNDSAINEELTSLVPKYPVETPDGKIFEFTLPNNETAIPNSLFVYLNGMMYSPANIELLSGCNKFRIINNDVLPEVTDTFYVIYRISNQAVKFADSTEIITPEEYNEITITETLTFTIESGDYIYAGTLLNPPLQGSVVIGNLLLPDESGYESGSVSFETFTESGYTESGGELGIISGEEPGEVVGALISDEGGSGWINYSTGEFYLIFAKSHPSGEIIKARYNVGV